MIRVFRHYVPKSLVVLGSGEAAILFGSVYLGVSFGLFDVNPTSKLLVGPLWTKALFYTGVMMLAMAGMGLYQRFLRDDLRGIIFRTGLALLLGLLIFVGALKFAPQFSIGSSAFSVAFTTSAAGVLLFRALLFRFAGDALFNRRVLMLGSGEMAHQVDELRRKVDRRDMTLLGFVRIPGEEVMVASAPLLEIKTTLRELADELEADEIVVAYDDKRVGFPVSQLLDCKMHGMRIVDLVRFFELQTGKIKIDALTPTSLVFSEGYIQAVLRGYVHRLFDIIVSLAVLALAWPLMLVTAVAIWVEAGGGAPVLYRQTRVGRNGRLFDVLKFRSMHVDAEAGGGAQWATPGDSRVTQIGALIRKLRIDELPQLINVLKGDMSFVGPRPERPQFVAELGRKIPYYELRHRVNPGITGWAQICYPYGSSERDAKEKLQFDLYYLKNYSLFLDIAILVQTVQVIIWGKGAR